MVRTAPELPDRPLTDRDEARAGCNVAAMLIGAAFMFAGGMLAAWMLS